ncbi:MAG TPA: D-alanine--D-alanine ligase [Flavobacteriaceae bacterium]|nr:D-alanine--D-alanine ligase [Flavobacteriaceae bacterium]
MKTKVAIIMGGYSDEFPISINSGNVVYRMLCKDKYEVCQVHILKEKWVYVSDEGKEFDVDKSDFSFETANGKFRPDVVFNIIHGTPGEDGLMQAYFELLGISQTSCEHYPSALTFNKRDTLSILKNYGIRCANAYYLNKGDAVNTDEIVKKVGLPCFVKPNKSGSSIGVSKVKDISDLQNAITFAFEQDDELLIETCITGVEVSVGVLQLKNEIIVFPPTEIVSYNEFFDYEAKYLGKSDEITPARISQALENKVQQITNRIYKLLNLKGISRADYIIQDDEPYFIEINTNPGLSEESIIPKQAQAYGMSLEQLFDSMIEEALR